ncbi:MAG TPA: DUF3488 and transglutaminase-like domain-containing protein [Acidobacteriota bacterium]|jgi:transglutaminase-like putative cysteine protease
MRFQRLFKIASYGLFTNGFLALAFTGAVDLTGVVLYCLVLVSSWWWDERKSALPSRLQNVLIFLYLAFYLIDLIYISRAVVATVHLVFFVSAIKLFSQKGPRDYLFLYLFSLAQLLIATTFTINILFLVNVFLFVLFGVACLILYEIYSSKRAFGDRCVGEDFWGPRVFFLNTTGLALLVCVLAVPFFFVVPRFPVTFLGYSSVRGAISGFSDQVHLGDIGRLKLNQTVVMRVKVDRPIEQIPYDLKWRGMSLNNFDGSSWNRLNVDGHPVMPNISGGYQLSGESYRPDEVLKQVFVVEPQAPGVLFHAPRLLTVSNEVQQLRVEGENYFYKKRPSGSKYTVFSKLVNRGQLLALPVQGVVPPPVMRRYLSLPELDPRVRDLTLSVTGPFADARRKALALEDYLKTHYRYSLDINIPRGADPLAYFLFESRSGHCEFFASAETVMLRSINIPARVVNGFRRGEFNNWGNNFIVRESNAHSWVEAFFPGIGWVELDPTPPDPDSDRQGWLAAMGHMFDAVDMFWTTEILTYDYWKQLSFFRTIRENVASVSGNLDRRIGRWKLQWTHWITREWWDHWQVPWKPTAVGAAGILVLAVLIRFRLSLMAAVAALLPRERASRVETALVARCYLQFLKKLERRGFKKRKGETGWELVSRIDGNELQGHSRRIVDLYYRLRFRSGLDGGLQEFVAAVEGMDRG